MGDMKSPKDPPIFFPDESNGSVEHDLIAKGNNIIVQERKSFFN